MSMNATFVQVDTAELSRLQADPSLVEVLFEDDAAVAAMPALVALTKTMQDRVRAAGPKMLADALSRLDPAIRKQLEEAQGRLTEQYMFDRKLHELIEAGMAENWTIMREHNHRMTGILEQIIASGMAAGEFHPGDAALSARLVNTACIRFCHPRLMVENEQEPEPVLDQMIDFCLAALRKEGKRAFRRQIDGRHPNPLGNVFFMSAGGSRLASPERRGLGA
jgi:hypothetical protein